MSRRGFVVVLDACGAGALPDASAYGDAGADTLGHLADAAGGLDLPTLQSLGLGSIRPLRGVAPAAAPVVHGRLAPLGAGKDSTTGHWELMGVVAPAPLPTYPDGFPPEVVEVVRRAAGGLEPLGNRPSDGLAAIADHGEHHLRTGEPIVYTSQDSVLQIAAHVDVLAPEKLYALCTAVRSGLPRAHAVGRVIARPFAGPPGAFERTDGRRDLSIAPPGRSYLDELGAAGIAVHAVGKVAQLFAGVGIDEAHPAATNARAIAGVGALVDGLDSGLAFANLVETDELFGHRNDVQGFCAALRGIDAAVAGWLERLVPGDLLVLTADHGCDPTTPGSDHTREYAPLLAVFADHGGRRHDGALADVGASVLRWLTGRDAPALPGTPFV